MTVKISIAVPSYNYFQYLEDCLNSIRAQDYGNFEVLIADGGSTDGSLDIIKLICKEDNRFRLVSTSDMGQPDAVVKALSQATGDILGFLNADDCYLCRDALSSVAQAFYAYPRADLVSFTGYYLDSQGRYIKPIRYRYHPLDSFDLMRYRTAVIQPATFWKRIVLETVPIRLDFHYSFDSVFFYEVYNHFTFVELSKPIAGYRLHGINKSVLIISKRIFEIARFERLKFGSRSLRSLYLVLIGCIIRLLEKLPVLGAPLCKLIYKIVNLLAFITIYRLPGI